MRIISGYLKGKKIFEPKNRKTRPLKDLTKESIFNVITHSNKFEINIQNSNILDLFSGVGSFGLEALSRGANHVTFIENYPIVIEILEKNIKNFNLNEKCSIIKKNIFKDLFFEDFSNQYDIIFLDPPFDEKHISSILFKIHSSSILKPKGIIILHRKSNFKENLIKEFKVIEERKYGISKIIFGNYLL